MGTSVEEAWQRASVVFNHQTLLLTETELREARDQARPFVKLVTAKFIEGLGDVVLPPRTRKYDVTLQLKGWSSELVLRYPRDAPKAGLRVRQYFDRFFVRLPTRDARLELRFALGEGDTRRDAWDVVQWGLFSWGTKERISKKASPVLQAIEERFPDLKLDPRESVAGVPGSAAQLGRVVTYSDFGADVQASVQMVADDLCRLLDAAQEYQD
jgi:hypothetical protein